MRSYSVVLQKLIVLLFLFACTLRAQQKEIVINVAQGSFGQSKSNLPVDNFLNGYRKSIRGQIIEYHSSHPDADKALLVRAKRDVGSISWETDTLVDVEGNYYNFIWLGGIEKSGWQQNTPHRFNLSINGKHWFTFWNSKDSTAMKWTVAGEDGSELSFISTMADRFGDLFGYMYLKLSKKEFKSGSPLAIEVVGEDADSPDWYMTFQYNFNFLPRLRLEPILLRMQSSSMQMLRLSLDNLHDGRTIEVIAQSQQPIRKSLNVGGNIIYIPVESVEKQQAIPIIFKIDGKIISESITKIEPIVKRDIYLLSYSHNDIGYTDLQPNIERKQTKNLDDALQLIDRTKDYPPDARYKWNMEVIWALESYLKQASLEKRQKVINEIKNGNIGLNALYANVLTGLANGVEMSHFTEYARKFSREYSTPITTACVSDIPGFTWGIVSILAQSGVKYFSSAPNSGDRVGYVYEALGDKPFYWVSQSGEEKVLMWLAAASYSSFHEGDLSKLGDEKILKMMRKLDDNNYPYTIVQLPYTIGGDNGTPDPNLSDFVLNWNDKYVSPRLIIATHEQMFTEFEKQYGSTLPTMKGDFTPYWEDGAFSTAKETFLNRHAADRLIQGEVLWSMRSPKNFPARRYYEAWRQVVLYDEHTWGAHNSITDPDSSLVKSQWAIKKQYALDADSVSQSLMTKALTTPIDSGVSTTYVYNANSWARSDLVLIPKEQSIIGDLVFDEFKKKIYSQRLSTGELAILAKDIPPFSAKRFFIKKGKSCSNGKANATGDGLENEFLSVKIDKSSGAIKNISWKKNNVQLVDSNRSANEYCYIPGTNPVDAKHLSNIKVSIKETGGLVVTFLVEAEAPGCNKFSTEYRIISGIERLDIINYLNKKAIREKEGIHFGFSLFNVPNVQLRYDVASGIIKPEQDQLPGSCKNFFSIQNFVDISNNDYGLTWATLDAPLIEIGAINAEKPWMKTIEQSHIFYSYVMNNYWHTNYKADQEGPVAIRYSIMPHGKYKSEDAVRFGREQREPLIAAAGDAGMKISPSLFTIEPSEILVTSCKPIDEGWLIQLYNASDRNQKTKINWNKIVPVVFYTSDCFGKISTKIKNRFVIPSYGTRNIIVNKK
jgi:alpha-mannosidase